MPNAQKLEIEVETKCNAQKFWDCVKDLPSCLRAIAYEGCESSEILEGHGKSVGTIFEIKQKPGLAFAVSKQKIELVDEEKKTVCYSTIGGNLMSYFKSHKVSIVGIPKGGDTTLTKWSCEFTKISDEISDDFVRDGIVKFARHIKAYLLKA